MADVHVAARPTDRAKTEAANAELKRVNAAQEAELKKLRKASRPC